MAKRINFTKDQEKEIIDFYLKPKGVEETALHFSVNESTILRVLRENSIPRHSKQVIYNLRLQKAKSTNLERYGVENVFQNENIKQKIKQSCLSKYGTDNYTKTDECKQKRKNTTLKKYGVENVFQNNEIKEKIKQKNQLKYGVENYSFTSEYKEKVKKTCLERYGVENYAKLSECKQKAEDTNLKKYGYPYHMQAPDYRSRLKDYNQKKFGVDFYTQTVEYKKKSYNTKKQNNSFNISKPEEDYYLYLIDKFGKENVLRQYRDSRYPFACDFYVKSEDLFIELNLHWTHGNHPFNKNNPADIEKLETWKKKHTEYYDNAVYVWSYLDLKKQKIAKENKLNYLAIY